MNILSYSIDSPRIIADFPASRRQGGELNETNMLLRNTRENYNNLQQHVSSILPLKNNYNSMKI